MARIARRETKRRLRIMAKATVDMERGVYVWPDGRTPIRPDGTPVVQKSEIVRAAGYSSKSAHAMDRWFADPYYRDHCQRERDKRDGLVPAAAVHVDVEARQLVRIAKRMFEILENRLKTTPDNFTTAQLLREAPVYLAKGRELLDPDSDPEKSAGGFTQMLGDIVVNMDPDERERMLRSHQRSSDDHMATVRSIVAATVTPLEDADADSDYVDAALTPESP